MQTSNMFRDFVREVSRWWVRRTTFEKLAETMSYFAMVVAIAAVIVIMAAGGPK